MTIVHHKNPEFSGSRCGLAFSSGTAYAPDGLTDTQRFHFTRWGLAIEEQEAPKGTSKKQQQKEENA
jgi:hypothetical protein